MRVPSSQEVAGKWEGHAKGYDVLHNFTPTGDLFVDIAGIGRIPDGKFWFEDDLVKIEDMTGGCENIIPSYEVYATFEGRKPPSFALYWWGRMPALTGMKPWRERHY